MPRKSTATRTINPLPFGDLEPHRFEDLVRNLIYDFKRWRSIEATGRAGGDEGFDVRAWEQTAEVLELDQQDEEPVTPPMEGNLWKIQCKREKQLGPSKVRAIIDEGVTKGEQLYGYILVAPTTFSKQSYDVFRNELRVKGVMEFYLWGKSELEDMLFLPKNDNILFAFFGISLVTRKRSLTADIKFSINNKNKLLRILGDGDPERQVYKQILVRDLKDTHYPYKAEYEDFDRLPRWKEYTAIRFHPSGLIVDVAKRFAYVDLRNKKFDFVEAVNLFRRHSDDIEERKKSHKKEQEVRSFWKYLPRANQAYFLVEGVICFDDMAAIDEKGDCSFALPHIFVDFKVQSGPFRGFFHSLKVGQEEIPLRDEYERISFFPKVFDPSPKGKIYKDRSVDFDEVTRRRFTSEYFTKSIFDVNGKYSYLKPGDVIRVVGIEPLVAGEETFIEVTHKYQADAKDYLKEHPADRDLIETQIGRKLRDTEKLTVLEFEKLSSWQLKEM
jgi:hypothetical protein